MGVDVIVEKAEGRRRGGGGGRGRKKSFSGVRDGGEVEPDAADAVADGGRDGGESS